MTPRYIADQIIKFYKSKIFTSDQQHMGLPHEEPFREMIESYLQVAISTAFQSGLENSRALHMKMLREGEKIEREECAKIAESIQIGVPMVERISTD